MWRTKKKKARRRNNSRNGVAAGDAIAGALWRKHGMSLWRSCKEISAKNRHRNNYK